MDAFDFSQSIPNGPRTVAERAQPRWFGHDLSGVPDSGIGYSGNARTRDDGVGRFGQSTFQPTLPQPTRHKRRAGGRVVTVSDVGLDFGNEAAMWGTPRKQALFGPEGQDSVSSVSHVVEAQPGWPPDDDFPEEARSPRADLANVVARLQKESGYRGSRNSMVPPRPSGRSGYTSTSVPMFAGETSWDQYRHVFEAIVSSNGWNGVTAALQLVSHLEGDTLTVALLVPASRRVMSGVLMDALTEHYSSPGRLADYRRHFVRISRRPGDNPSVFAVELETLAMRAFGELSPLARLQMVHDRFITGQRECSLHRHLDGVELGTPIWDIVDRCRVWESHAEAADCWGEGPILNQPLPVCLIGDVETESVPMSSSNDQNLFGFVVASFIDDAGGVAPEGVSYSFRV